MGHLDLQRVIRARRSVLATLVLIRAMQDAKGIKAGSSDQPGDDAIATYRREVYSIRQAL